MPDGSYERREGRGHGLKAYKKEPKHKFFRNVYVLISPLTYSGASELSNMIYTNQLATFVGQETGGGYYGNTSGYTEELTLPKSQITIEIPALKFEANVEDTIPFGRGVIPHHQVIPTYEQRIAGENSALEFILELIRQQEKYFYQLHTAALDKNWYCSHISIIDKDLFYVVFNRCFQKIW